MGTATYYYQTLDPSLVSQISNGTSMNYASQINSYNNDQPIHLFVLIALWIVLLVTIIFGTTGNVLVLYVYINRKDNKTCTFFIKMLAVVDLIICLILAPLELYQITTGIRNEFLCKFYGFLSTHVLYSTLLITTIAFDRYFCICWPLYKIITIHRARAIVIVCGLFSSLLAIIPMTEYSTLEHLLQVHNNHSERFSIKYSDENNLLTYNHVEHIKKIDSSVPFIVGNMTDVICSPKSNLHLASSTFIDSYRMFHSTLFAICLLLVLVLYAFIYNAVYQRRITRTRKLSAYRRIIRSYLMHNEVESTGRGTRSAKNFRHHHHHNFPDEHSPPSTLTLICCYCCKTSNEYMHELQRPSEAALHEPLNQRGRRQLHLHHMQDEPSSALTNQHHHRPQIVLEVNGARGKRYSAISMTSMTYLTSGIWDETTSTNLIRSRINSIAATTYCGTEHSSNSRPSTSTEDSFDQTTKLLSPNNTFQLRSMTPPSATHLTVPGLQTPPPTTPTLAPTSDEFITKDNQLKENELPRSVSQCANLRHSSIARKSSNTLSIRQQQRPSDTSVHQRKVSFLTSGGLADQCISEDSSNTYQRSSLTPHNLSLLVNQSQQQQQQQQQNQLTVHINNNRSLSTVSSIDHRNSSIRNFSISSARRPSTFDGETQRVLERQQTQERLANIRTTFTLFIVTAVFILMYLPSLIHTLFKIEPHNFREILFILYYINSACNPLIYSFFNVNFRNDIRRIYECQKREYFARQY
ncbi:unnamed protein product [Rotaria socialis]|uniref:G-protein coupled receptors family 1 profile domain-containing protein n=1 Tax=Rotaria socialis TaxID=392032 RepID=A0A818ABN0_9BILA|nr:unnamed protein product [Rotaria socialis]CAF3525374.1 unnamed protein product [Rotaria socialis]CAF3611028.1 unnamed protein product [Rotaria socialis]CAF4113534.1 unnamed protein product [Rotaria socialis]CAF4128173.1 unnamed protein product [Rotaria socialis]